jgi:opacity protein-like surface antigen
MKNLLIAVISIFIISSASAAADQNTIIYVGSGSQINDSKNFK